MTTDPGAVMPDSEADWEAYYQIGEDWDAEEEAQAGGEHGIDLTLRLLS
jgi:hypothetical protein